MKPGHLKPPQFFDRLFRWFCKDKLYAELAGDLLEEYQWNLRELGARKARTRYRLEVLKMIRPSVVRHIKTSKTHFNHTAMFKNYTLVAFRNLVRNKLFSSINIIGLSISMAVGLLTIAFVGEVSRYDSFHENKDRIYRLNNYRVSSNGGIQPYASTSLMAGERIRNDLAGVEKVVSIANSLGGYLEVENDLHSIRGYHASREFLEVFTFPLLQGNPATALDEPYSLLLTKTAAERIFGRTDVLGEVVKRGEDQYQITGVLEDIPNTSHLKFEAVASLTTYEMTEARKALLNDWTYMWSSYAYLLLPEGHDVAQVQASLDRLAAEENEKGHRFKVNLGMEALKDIFPGDGKYNQIAVVMPKENINSMVILTLIVLFSACFNYANLSIARSLKRAKEIGVRKVVGALKRQIFIQFVAEAIMVSIFALIIAFVLFRLIKPEFIQLNFYIQRTIALDVTTSMYLAFFAFAVVIGFLAGTLPALLMMNFKPVTILKGVSNLKMTRGMSLRKVLIALQFTLSMAFAILVTLAYKQYRYALNFDLGYNTENILNIYLQGNDADLMRSAMEKIPEVQDISISSMIPSTGGLNSDVARILGSQDSIISYSLNVDERYIENMGHTLLAGKNFSSDQRSGNMIVNEQFVKAMGFESPQDILDQRVAYYGDTNRVIGVVRDFHYGTVYNELLPFAFSQSSSSFIYLNLKIASTDMVATMDKLSNAWSEVDSKQPFNASFFSESIEQMYNTLSSSIKTYGFLAIVAISISILGLLGMAVYTAEARIKELTIRKVLGASIYNLLSLLSRNFLLIFVIASAIAIPISFEFFKSKIAQDMEYITDIGFWELSSGVLIVIAISMLTIGSQAIKAARTNPAENLRNE